jgi:hypothetical protein
VEYYLSAVEVEQCITNHSTATRPKEENEKKTTRFRHKEDQIHIPAEQKMHMWNNEEQGVLQHMLSLFSRRVQSGCTKEE